MGSKVTLGQLNKSSEGILHGVGLTIILSATKDGEIRGTVAHFIVSPNGDADIGGWWQGIQVLLQVGCVHFPHPPY